MTMSSQAAYERECRRLARISAAKQIGELCAENTRLRQALQDIAEPLPGIERRAKADGCVVNYPMALAMIENANYLRGLARDAIKSCK